MDDDQGARLWVSRADLRHARTVADPDAPANASTATGRWAAGWCCGPSASTRAASSPATRTGASCRPSTTRRSSARPTRPTWPRRRPSSLIDDFLAGEGFFGAAQVLLSSASSKTGFAAAFCLAWRRGTATAVRVLGCSSPRNLDFCRSLGVYDEVLAYDALPALDPQLRTVYVDFAGDADFRRRVHEHFGDALTYSCSVGGTHWQALGGGRDLAGPKPVLFFAPAHIARRSAAPPEGWGAALLNERIGEAWSAFLRRVGSADPPWLRVRDFAGPQAACEALAAMVEGRVDPREGWMISV